MLRVVAPVFVLFLLMTTSSCDGLSRFISGCAPETGPAIEGIGVMEGAFTSTSGAFEKFVNHPKVTMTPEVKAAMMKAILQDRADFITGRTAMMNWLDAVGSIDYKALYEKGRAIWDQITKS